MIQATYKYIPRHNTISNKTFLTEGKTIFQENSNNIQKILANNTNSSGIMNATNIKAAMFPRLNCDIFLSHSSKDNELAYYTAGHIQKKCGKSVFIDSALWGNMYELEEKINDKYSILKETTHKAGHKIYNHNNVLKIASNTRMILCTALFSMILNCKYFIFLQTENSLVENSNTHSPWIYYELYTAYNLQKLVNNKQDLEIITEATEMEFDIAYIINNFKEIRNLKNLI
jgi:hypothetical protein